MTTRTTAILRCASAAAGSRELDADVYESLGFEVFRAAIDGRRFAWKYRGVGDILFPARQWLALQRVTTSTDAAAELLHPGQRWSIERVGRGYMAVCGAHVATAADRPLAICTLALRLLAHGVWAPERALQTGGQRVACGP